MIDLVVTVDAESGSKRIAGDRVLHDRFEEDVLDPCLALDELGRALGVALTFFFPLGELAASHPDAGLLGQQLAERNELGVHAHVPSAAWEVERLRDLLERERRALRELTGREASSVRAGGYNTGDDARWIAAAAGAGLTVDSSVWPGATSSFGEGARGGSRLASAWGREAVRFDHRGAPTAGLYRAAEDALSRPGTGPLLEAPIASAFYEEREPGPFRLDPSAMPLGLLLRTVEEVAVRAELRGLAVMILHTPGIARRGRLTRLGRRLERFLGACLERGVVVRTLGSAAELDVAVYGPVYAPEQLEAWGPVDRSDLLPLVARCPRCGSGLERLACAACGWTGRRLAPALVDARPVVLPESPAADPSRGARYLRAALALSGGILAAAVGSTIYAGLRLRRLLGLGRGGGGRVTRP